MTVILTIEDTSVPISDAPVAVRAYGWLVLTVLPALCHEFSTQLPGEIVVHRGSYEANVRSMGLCGRTEVGLCLVRVRRRRRVVGYERLRNCSPPSTGWERKLTGSIGG